MIKEWDILWQKNDDHAAAITTQDTVIQRIIERCQETELKVNYLNSDLLANKEEKSLEIKLKALIETIYVDVEKKINSLKDFTLNKLHDMHNKIDKIQQQYHKELPHTEKYENKESQMLKEEVIKINVKTKQIEDNENGFRTRIAQLEDEIKSINVNITYINGIDRTSDNDDLRNKVSSTEKEVQLLGRKINRITIPSFGLGGQRPAQQPTVNIDETRHRTTQSSSTQQFGGDGNHSRGTNTRTNAKRIELLVCMDSNGRYIEPKKLWKVRGSEYKKCSTLYDVHNTFKSFESSRIEHALICVGVNDLDDKEHNQVFSVAELLINEIRSKHNNIKIPRKDGRDPEVIAFNQLLESYAKQHSDVTIVVHNNLRDSSWSMFKRNDIKHIRNDKVVKFAGNIIGALKKAYGISNKSELFYESLSTPQ